MKTTQFMTKRDNRPQICKTFKSASTSSTRTRIAGNVMEKFIVSARPVLIGQGPIKLDKRMKRIAGNVMETFHVSAKPGSIGEGTIKSDRTIKKGPDYYFGDRTIRVYPDDANRMNEEDLHGKKIFFDKDCKTKSGPQKQMKIIDLDIVDKSGYLLDDNNDLVCFVHNQNICKRIFGKQGNLICDTLQEVQEKSNNVKRAKSKMEDDPNAVYACIGHKNSRNRRGIELSSFAVEHKEVYDNLVKMAKKSEHLINSELPSSYRQAVFAAKAVVPWDTMNNNTSKASAPTIYATLAAAKGYTSPAHTDDDFIGSSLQLHCPEAIGPDGWYQQNLPIAQYFAYPTFGVAFALRPGRSIYFNPLYFHCCSERTDYYLDKSVYISAFYLKSMVVGGNNNALPLDEIQTTLYDEMTSDVAKQAAIKRSMAKNLSNAMKKQTSGKKKPANKKRVAKKQA